MGRDEANRRRKKEESELRKVEDSLFQAISILTRHKLEEFLQTIHTKNGTLDEYNTQLATLSEQEKKSAQLKIMLYQLIDAVGHRCLHDMKLLNLVE